MKNILLFCFGTFWLLGCSLSVDLSSFGLPAKLDPKSVLRIDPPSNNSGNKDATFTWTIEYINVVDVYLDSDRVDVLVKNGDVSCGKKEVTGISPFKWAVTLSQCLGSGSLRISIKEKTAKNEAGDFLGSFLVDNLVSIDNEKFSITFSSQVPSVTDMDSIEVFAETSSLAPAFKLESIEVENGTIQDWQSMSATKKKFVLKALDDGDVRIIVRDESILDVNGNKNNESIMSFLIHRGAPKVLIEGPPQVYFNSQATLDFFVRVVGVGIQRFTPDVQMVGVGLDGCVMEPKKVDEVKWSVKVSGCLASSGEMSLVVAGGAAKDIMERESVSSESSKYYVDNTPPTMTLSGSGSLSLYSKTQVSLTIPNVPEDFFLQDRLLSFSGDSLGCQVVSRLSNVNSGTATFHLLISNCSAYSGNVVLNVASGMIEDKAGNKSSSASLTFPVSNRKMVGFWGKNSLQFLENPLLPLNVTANGVFDEVVNVRFELVNSTGRLSSDHIELGMGGVLSIHPNGQTIFPISYLVKALSTFVSDFHVALTSAQTASGLPVEIDESSASVVLKFATANRYSQVSVSERLACVLDDKKEVKCWGNSASLIPLKPSPSLRAEEVDPGIKYQKIQTAPQSLCGLTYPTGELRCTGLMQKSLFNEGAGAQYQLPVRLTDKTYKDFAYRNNTICAIDEESSLFCWGQNDKGQVGNNSKVLVSLPHLVSSVKFKSVDLGEGHACAVSLEGSLYCWGANTNGQLGVGDKLEKLLPSLADDGRKYNSVVLGERLSCGIDTEGNARCWGQNAYGNRFYNNMSTLDYVKSTPFEYGYKFKNLSVGKNSICGVTFEGELRCRGESREYFRWMNLDTSGRPLDIFTSTDPGEKYLQAQTKDTFGCAITEAGFIKCWGSNDYGQLGKGYVSVPSTPQPAPWLDRFKDISLGSLGGCGIDEDDYLSCWGRLSLSHLVSRYYWAPVRMPFEEKFKKIELGEKYGCGITLDGTKVACWGGEYPAMGLGNYNPPTENLGRITYISFPESVKSIIDLSAGYKHACAIVELSNTTTVMYCWGDNLVGDFNSASQYYLTPISVGPAIKWKEVRASKESTCGISEAGALWCIGGESSYSNGKEGRAARVLHNLDAGKSFSNVASALMNHCAIVKSEDANNGLLRCWGRNMTSRLSNLEFPLNDRSPGTLDGTYKYKKIFGKEARLYGLTTDNKIRHINEYGNVVFTDQTNEYDELYLGTSSACGRLKSGGVMCWENLQGAGKASAFSNPVYTDF